MTHNRLDDISDAAKSGTEQLSQFEQTNELDDDYNNQRTDSKTTSPEMVLFFEQNDAVQEIISKIKTCSKEIARLEDVAVNAVRSKDEKEASTALEVVLNEGRKLCENGKDTLSLMENQQQQISAQKGNESDLRIRRNIEATLRQNFVFSVREFQQAQIHYKNCIKSKVERQVKLVKPDASSEEIDLAFKSGDAGAIYRAAILKPGEDPIEQAYADVQVKFKDVLRLEESVRALNQMFKDMALLSKTYLFCDFSLFL